MKYETALRKVRHIVVYAIENDAIYNDISLSKQLSNDAALEDIYAELQQEFDMSIEVDMLTASIDDIATYVADNYKHHKI